MAQRRLGGVVFALACLIGLFFVRADGSSAAAGQIVDALQTPQAWPPPGAVLAGNGVSDPKLIREVKPNYTVEALQEKIQGKVGLECVVEIDGGVNLVRVVQSLDPTFGLDQQAIIAVKQWRFEPATKDGKPVRVLVSVELTFTLKDGPAGTLNRSSTEAAAPLKWPDPFISGSGSQSPADERWQQIRLDDANANAVVSVNYPQGWVAIQGFPNIWLVLENTTAPAPEILVIQHSFPAGVRLAEALSQNQLSEFAGEIGRRMGRSPTAYGQVETSKRLWVWFDLGERPTVENPAVAPWVSLLKPAFERVRTWQFVTTVDDQAFLVLCFVARGRNASDAEMSDEVHRAGPMFAKILDRLGLERR